MASDQASEVRRPPLVAIRNLDRTSRDDSIILLYKYAPRGVLPTLFTPTIHHLDTYHYSVPFVLSVLPTNPKSGWSHDQV
ncbi:hypothetical protein PILCRDRAFT_826017 [Piloderma croceum F 1598]|uniref:Uncharacterized protein n=1 Tax=Piloderma croceum (strain F 1598) TaxID=765440 RepID=A0A0C3EWB1_PILCF|nr:hypothetical protein PILCRDRAFT_826017 [Piloderma croceum F 1598]